MNLIIRKNLKNSHFQNILWDHVRQKSKIFPSVFLIWKEYLRQKKRTDLYTEINQQLDACENILTKFRTEIQGLKNKKAMKNTDLIPNLLQFAENLRIRSGAIDSILNEK